MKTILKGLLRAVAISAALWSVSAKAQTIYAGTATLCNDSDTHFYQWSINVSFTWLNSEGQFEFGSQDLDSRWDGSDLAPLEQRDLYDLAVSKKWTRWGLPVPSIIFVDAYSLGGYHYQLPASAPTSSDASIAAGTSWAPTTTFGVGLRQLVWCVAGYTNWGSGKWTPPGPGTYTFFVGGLPSPGYSTNEDDPLIGKIEVNYTGYTLVVY